MKKSIEEYRCSFQTINNMTTYYRLCFAINVLRNLAIETIRTTHYMIVDGDSIISSMAAVIGLIHRYYEEEY